MRIIKEKETCSLSTLSKFISEDLHLSDFDLKEMTRGGSLTKHKSNLNYCVAYLKKMGLIERLKQGVYKITPRGIQVLDIYKDKLNLSTLRELPEYILTQYNPKNKDMVIVKPHIKGNKMVGAYLCHKDSLSKNNPNLYNPICLDEEKQ